MVKLIKKIALLSILWSVSVYLICLLLPFHYFNAEYPIWLSKMQMMKEKNPYKNLIIGDSRAIAGLSPKILGEDYYNMALGGATPMEGYFMLKKMLDQGKKIDTILVSYAPIHFEQSEMFWDRQLKYNFYNLEDIHEIFENLNEKNERFWRYGEKEYFKSDQRKDHIRKAYLTYLRSPMELRAELSKSLLLRGYTNYGVYKEIKQRKGSYDFGKNQFSHDLNVEAKRKKFMPKEIILQCMEKMFSLASTHNIKVIYMSLPMNETSYAALSPNYRKGVREMHQKLSEDHPEVHFNNIDITFYKDYFFGDASHLNDSGRKKFSLEVKEQLVSDQHVKPETLFATF